MLSNQQAVDLAGRWLESKAAEEKRHSIPPDWSHLERSELDVCGGKNNIDENAAVHLVSTQFSWWKLS